MLSENAVNVLSYELGELIEENEFDQAYFELIDNHTALVLRTRRGQRTCGFKFPSFEHVDLPLALATIRGFYKRREVN
jgi:hypothetical protein